MCRLQFVYATVCQDWSFFVKQVFAQSSLIALALAQLPKNKINQRGKYFPFQNGK